MNRVSLQAISSQDRLLQTLLDPVAFSKSLLRMRLWEKQEEVERAILDNRRVAVRACHSSGKTAVAAAIALWWLMRWPKEALVVTTAPTWIQVRSVFWRELHRRVELSSIAWPKPNQTELKLADGNLAIGLSPKESDRFQGLHAKKLLLLFDEGPGVAPQIWEAGRSLLASGDSRWLVLGNPTSAAGPFYDVFEKQQGWARIHISAYDMPTLRGLKPGQPVCVHGNSRICIECGRDPDAWPFLCSPGWVEDARLDWGIEHPFWVTRVLGDFSVDDLYSLFPLSALSQAELPCEHDHNGDDLAAGVDVAGGGADSTVVQLCAGWCRIGCKAFHEKDARGPVVEYLGQYRDRLRVVNVDATGVGYHFAYHLMDQGFPVHLIYPGGGSSDPNRWLNRRAELFSKASKAVRDGMASGLAPRLVLNADDQEEITKRGLLDIQGSDRTSIELAQIRSDNMTSRGQLKIADKSDLKAQLGGKSPDYADAYVMAGSDPSAARDRELSYLAQAYGYGPPGTPDVPALVHEDGQPLHHVLERRLSPPTAQPSRLMRLYEKALARYSGGQEP